MLHASSFDRPSQFYSWYIYPEHDRDFGKSISSAEYVDDVDTDSVVIIDGLTKVEAFHITRDPSLKARTQNWRLPGWRVCWVLGPKNLITALSQSGQSVHWVLWRFLLRTS